MIKVVRYQIVPVEMEQFTFKQIYAVLWQLQKETMQIANRTIQLCWEFAGFERDYKRRFDIYPDGEVKEKALGYKALNSFIYKELTKEFVKLNTGNLGATLYNTYNKFNREKLKYLKGEISIPSYKNSIPIDVSGKNITFRHDNASGQWSTELSLLSNTFKKELGLATGRLIFKMFVKSGLQKEILERCLDGEFKICSSKILYSRGKWFLNLSYGFDHETNKPVYHEDLIMGVYLGEFNAVYCTFNKTDNYLKLDGGEVEEYRRKIEARKMKLLKQSKECGEGRIGHGYHTRIKPVETIGNKISNYRNTITHKYSKLIVFL
mgnify:CR=1 FL=1